MSESETFTRLPLIGTSGDLRADAQEWLGSRPLAALVELFGGDPGDYADRRVPLPDRLAKLDLFTEQWDTRQGRERNLAAELDLTPAQSGLVIDAANALGLRGQAPRHRHYDHMLMLGGLVRACVARPSYAAQLIRSGEITAGEVTTLGAHRPFVGNEFEQAEQLGWGDLREEYEALDAGTRRAFELGEPEREEGEQHPDVGGTWGVKHYRGAEGLPVRVVAAPSSEPDRRRADTADSYTFFARHVAALRPGERLLLISTAIYVLPQHLAAVRILALPFGVEVDTIGALPTNRPRLPLSNYSATKYLLEVRSTVRALSRLAPALEDGAQGSHTAV
ncbi:hypothetical protein KDL01_29805 [Actinospica durhamensis]|uniref:Uncharacterized protein n=1 Tax=Actinospica durhamensis TaxID=1508375 RepID=A0A941ESZ4_9ACTN|nr:hypothetical protein [Actinospica durhamensis]MBR7837512.1 hypothetical protein [Actinospica durhamensis]